MELERFQALAERYGADIGRWPAAERAAASDLANQADVAATLEAVAELDAWLDSFRVSGPSPALREAVLAAAPRKRREERAWGLDFSYWLSGAGFAAAMAAGVALGVGWTGGSLRQIRHAEALGLGAADSVAEFIVEPSP